MWRLQWKASHYHLHPRVCCGKCRDTNNVGQTTTDQPQGTIQPSRAAITTPATTSLMSCIITKIPVLLQTATTQVFRANNSNMRTNARIMFDNGSQRSYVTNSLVRQLSFDSRCSEAMIIQTFGSHQDTRQVCDIHSITKDSSKEWRKGRAVVPFSAFNM